MVEREFKVGDFVTTLPNDITNKVVELTEDLGYDFKCKDKDGGFGYIVKSFLPVKWRHATEEEEKVGHRIDTKCGNLFCDEPSEELLCKKCKARFKEKL